MYAVACSSSAMESDNTAANVALIRFVVRNKSPCMMNVNNKSWFALLCPRQSLPAIIRLLRVSAVSSLAGGFFFHELRCHVLQNNEDATTRVCLPCD